MKITKAIEILSIELGVKTRTGETDEYDALKLGIEALKRFKRVRDGKPGFLLNLLLGETEE